jgi:hypothetical protein
MSADYIPPEDLAYDEWLENFTLGCVSGPAQSLVPLADRNALSAAQAQYHTAFNDLQDKKNAYEAAVETKNALRQSSEALARRIAGDLQRNPGMTDALRRELDLTVPKDGRTPTPPISTHPIMQKIDTSTRLILRLFYADSATPERSQKPAGAQFCEIREKIGAPAPASPESMVTLALEGRAPYRADFTSEQAGQPVWFALRWVDRLGRPGPWSPLFSSAVPV